MQAGATRPQIGWENTQMATVKNPDDTSGRLIAASKVNGTNVYNLSGEKIGSVYDVMLDKHTGKTEYAIMSFGGFLGMGERYHPLPWHVLTYSPSQGGFVVDLDRTRLEGAPSYDTSNSELWGDDTWGERVDDYYGAPTHEDLRSGMGGAGLGGIPPRV